MNQLGISVPKEIASERRIAAGAPSLANQEAMDRRVDAGQTLVVADKELCSRVKSPRQAAPARNLLASKASLASSPDGAAQCKLVPPSLHGFEQGTRAAESPGSSQENRREDSR